MLLQVLDEHGRGVPVGFMICSSDTVEVVEKFLRALQEGVSQGLLALAAAAGCCRLLLAVVPAAAS